MNPNRNNFFAIFLLLVTINVNSQNFHQHSNDSSNLHVCKIIIDSSNFDISIPKYIKEVQDKNNYETIIEISDFRDSIKTIEFDELQIELLSMRASKKNETNSFLLPNSILLLEIDFAVEVSNYCILKKTTSVDSLVTIELMNVYLVNKEIIGYTIYKYYFLFGDFEQSEHTYLKSIEIVGGFDFTITPNPCIDFLTVSNKKEKIVLVELISLTGELILKESNNEFQSKINVQQLTRGQYFVQITNEKGEKKIKKFVKI
jgi:hypothetical protein